jgi:SAM-dependent methyltransferase
MITLPTMDCDTDVARLMDMSHAMWMTQALYAAVELGLVDALAAHGPQRAEALAGRLSCNPTSLARLLRGLTALGVCAEFNGGVFELTGFGEPLVSSHPQSLRDWVLLAGRRQWQTWSGFTEAVRTGQPVGLRHDDRDRFDRLQRDPAEARDLHNAMAALTRQLAHAVAGRVATLAPAGTTVVDVGGGNGELLCAVLQAAPSAIGVVLDRAHAATQATARFEVDGLGDRASFCPGDFFKAVPEADLLLMKSVLHDWDDARCVQLLANCTAALRPGGAVAIVERVVPDRIDRTAAHRHAVRSDLNMLVATGGRERGLAAFDSLLSAVGLRIEQLLPAALDFAVLVARPAAGVAQ